MKHLFRFLLPILVALPAYSADFRCIAGDTACLVSSITVANANNEANTITLQPGSYSPAAVQNMTEGANAFPSITGQVRIAAAAPGAVLTRPLTSPGFRFFHVAEGGSLSLDGISLAQGRADLGRGGAILNRGSVSINNGIISLAAAVDGGGIYNAGTLTAAGITVSDSTATVGGGISSPGILLVSDSLFLRNNARDGGGIFIGPNVTPLPRPLTGFANIVRSTFRHNGAEGGSAIQNNGTLFMESDTVHQNVEGVSRLSAALLSKGAATIASSTFAENYGGAISQTGSMLIKNSTIVWNTTWKIVTPGVSGNGARIQNSIVALNATVGPIPPGAQPPRDCSGIVSLGHNIFGASDSCQGLLNAADLFDDPLLGEAAEDTGIKGTLRFPPTSRSIAVDNGDATACPPVDQLGQRRVAVCEIGAVEFIPVK